MILPLNMAAVTQLNKIKVNCKSHNIFLGKSPPQTPC
jgi:hypothetical protein